MDMNMLQQLLAGAGQGAPAPPPPLAEVKAGRMNLRGTTVTPDVRKGKIVVIHSDGLIHFQWFTRPGTEPEQNLIVFPGDATFEKVSECTTGRVYLLTFRSSGMKHFYWLQDLKTDKDEEIVTKIVNVLTNGVDATGKVNAPKVKPVESVPAVASVSVPAVSVPAASAVAAASTVSSAVSSAKETPAPVGSSEAAISNIMANFVEADLNDVIQAELMDAFISDPEVLSSLLPHLPPGQQTLESLKEHLTSPQVQQAADRLTAVLRSEQMVNLMSQFGLATDGSIGVNAFLRAIDRLVKDKNSNSMDIDKK